MKVRDHPQIISWPPNAQGPEPPVGADYPQSESQSIIRKVHAVVDKSFTLTSEFKRNSFQYNVRTTDPTFAKDLAAEFGKHVGDTLEQFGDLEVNF